MAKASSEPIPGLFHSWRNQPMPPAASSSPKRLAGRRAQAISPTAISAQPAARAAAAVHSDDPANPKPGELWAIASDPSPTASPIGQNASQTARLRPPAGFMRASSQAPRASSIGDGELASSQHPERVSPKLRM
jgi:hypothetical protein